jgi:tetratricopeptide (TPR) repeat protein
MGFWKSFFGGEPENPEEEKKNAEDKNFDVFKYDGVKAMRIGQFDYAERCFREAMKIKDDLEVNDYLSQTLMRLGRLDEALAEMRIMINAQPSNAALLLQAAHVAYMLEDYDEMKKLCEQALALNAENAMANYMMAQAVLGQNDMISGIAYLTKAVSQNATLGDARLLRAKTLLKMGDIKGASEDVVWLLEHTEADEDVLLMAARVAHLSGKDDTALDIYNKVIELNPFQMDAYRERGQIRYEKGDKKGAEDDMQKLLEMNPNELADVSGDYSAEGVEQAMKRVYSAINPFGL